MRTDCVMCGRAFTIAPNDIRPGDYCQDYTCSETCFSDLCETSDAMPEDENELGDPADEVTTLAEGQP